MFCFLKIDCHKNSSFSGIYYKRQVRIVPQSLSYYDLDFVSLAIHTYGLGTGRQISRLFTLEHQRPLQRSFVPDRNNEQDEASSEIYIELDLHPPS